MKTGHGRLSSRTGGVAPIRLRARALAAPARCTLVFDFFEKPHSRIASERVLLPAARSRQTLRFSAEVLPRLATSSYSTVCPSLSVERPAFSTAEICTNTSLPPLLGWINPKPLVGLNHFTIPLAITSSPQN